MYFVNVPAMSVHLEETSASFDVQTASTLYWKTVPVLLKQQDREETVEDLNVRLLSGVNRHNHNLRVRLWYPFANRTAGK